MAIKSGKNLSSNMEDYLEAIVLLKNDKGVARVKDIGGMMSVKKPSVTGALSALAKGGFVVHERYGYVDLTRQGEKIAKAIQRRHDLLTKFLVEILNIDSQIAAEDACKMEHAISPQTLKKLTKFIEFVKTCSYGNRPDWLESFDYYFKTGRRRKCKRRAIKAKQDNKYLKN